LDGEWIAHRWSCRVNEPGGALFGLVGRSNEQLMIVEYIRYELQPENHETFLSAYRSAAAELGSSPHCVRYEITQGVEEPNNFTVRIEWDSVEGHEKRFRASAQFGPFFTKVKPYFAAIREMKHYEVRASGAGRARG
jgi:quinol monooxygenase YgiN